MYDKTDFLAPLQTVHERQKNCPTITLPNSTLIQISAILGFYSWASFGMDQFRHVYVHVFVHLLVHAHVQ